MIKQVLTLLMPGTLACPVPAASTPGAALQEQGFAITLPKRTGAVWLEQKVDWTQTRQPR